MKEAAHESSQIWMCSAWIYALCILSLMTILPDLSYGDKGSEPISPKAPNFIPSSARFANHSINLQKRLMIDIMHVNGRTISIGDKGHILILEEGESWQQILPVPTQNLLTAATAIGELLWVVGHDGIILKSDNSGTHWAIQRLTPYSDLTLEGDARDQAGNPLLDVWFLDKSTGYAVGAYGYFLKTTDSGDNWQDQSVSLNNIDGFHLNAIDGVGDEFMLVAGEAGTLFLSNDAGNSWRSVDTGSYSSWFGVELGLYPDKIYLYGVAGSLVESVDQGKSWRRISLLNRDSGERVTDGILGSTLLSTGELLLVGTSGLVVKLDPRTHRHHIQYHKQRHSLSGAIEVQGITWAVGKGGVIKLQ